MSKRRKKYSSEKLRKTLLLGDDLILQQYMLYFAKALGSWEKFNDLRYRLFNGINLLATC